MPGIDLLLATTARLRAPDGCPWDREQTHRTICDCLVEEVAELLQAIDLNDDANLREELGDLLFHIAMHAQLAAEAGKFTFDDVAREVSEDGSAASGGELGGLIRYRKETLDPALNELGRVALVVAVTLSAVVVNMVAAVVVGVGGRP